MGVICGVVLAAIGAVLVIVISSVGYAVVPGIVERTIINVSILDICMKFLVGPYR